MWFYLGPPDRKQTLWLQIISWTCLASLLRRWCRAKRRLVMNAIISVLCSRLAVSVDSSVPRRPPSWLHQPPPSPLPLGRNWSHNLSLCCFLCLYEGLLSAFINFLGVYKKCASFWNSYGTIHNFTHTIAVTFNEIWLSSSMDFQCGNRYSPGLNDQFLSSSDTVESEGRQMKQCWMQYLLLKFKKSLFKDLDMFKKAGFLGSNNYKNNYVLCKNHIRRLQYRYPTCSKNTTDISFCLGHLQILPSRVWPSASEKADRFCPFHPLQHCFQPYFPFTGNNRPSFCKSGPHPI